MDFTLDKSQDLSAAIGVSHIGTPVVDPGQSLVSPACVTAFSPAGKGTASRNIQSWVRKYGMRDGDRLRLVDNNSWEGCKFKLSEARVLEMMKGSAELGIELYVLDDGWFGNGVTARTGAKSGLGDWQVNRERFPHGLKILADKGQEENLAFGLWFEPEMVNPRSQLFKDHPDWVMRVPGSELKLERNQAALDLANPDVQKFIFMSVDDILTAVPGIRFVKWDCNSDINNPGSPYLAADRQGDLLRRYFEGYYGVLERLTKKHPQVDFQACASGGGRADLGAMRFSHTFWVSDNTNPMFRLNAQWNFSTFLPAIAMTCHVTHAGKEFRPKFRFDVSMMGQLGMEIDPTHAEPAYQAAAKVGIAAYKTVREVVQFGTQYRHLSPQSSSTPSLNYVAADQSKAVILAYQTGEIAGPLEFPVPVQGLDPKRIYKLAEINLPPEDNQPRVKLQGSLQKTGKGWMAEDIPLQFTRRYDSAALTLTSTP